MSSERSLADVAEQVQVVDASVPQTPESFDLEGWLQGVRPVRRSVKLLPNGHLVARLEQIVQQINDAGEDDNVDDLVDEFEQVKAKAHQGVWFTFEARSSEWVKKFRNDVSAQGNFKVRVDDQGLMKGDDDKINAVLDHQIAAQIVEPSGVTAEQIIRLRQVSNEHAKLVVCLAETNSSVVNSAEVMNRDFSARRSGNRTTEES